ncbi:Hypothetical protein D9617_20g028040 [Elsinoe fawcettii]|nr:Hypothetical protein D9617_20g028040 [Elsinoe fawcettii]
MHIFYTGYSLAEQGKQTILHTQADDLHGSSFGATEPIKIRHSNGSQAVFEDIDFRDAYVFFNELTSEWWMLVATRLATGPTWFRGCIALLTSTDLEEWTMQPGPLYSPGDMYCPECPELFRLPNGKWYLLYSRFAAPDAGTVYRVADSPLGPFRIPRDGSGGRIDGRRWYAAKSCPKHDDPAQRVSFGWIADKCDADGKWLWGGDLALPRVLSANGDGSLLTSVAQEPIDLFLETSKSLLPVGTHHDLSSIGSVATEFLPLGDSCDEDLVLEFSVGLCDASAYGLILNSDKDLRGYRVSFDSRNAGTCDMTLLCDQIPLDDFWADQYNLHLPRPVDGPEL